MEEIMKKKPADQKTLLTLYRLARKAIAKKGAWIQGVSLIGKTGRETDWADCAVRFCATGVLDHIAYLKYGGFDDHGLFDEHNISKPLVEASGQRGPRGVEKWNDVDGRTQKEVVAVFDKAIQLIASRLP